MPGTTTHYLFKPGYIHHIQGALACFFSECDKDMLDGMTEKNKNLVKKIIKKNKNFISDGLSDKFQDCDDLNLYVDEAEILLNGYFQYGNYDKKYSDNANKKLWEKNSNNFKNFKLMYSSNQWQKNELFLAKKICVDYLLNDKYPITPGKHYHDILGEPIKIDYSICKAIYKYEPMPFYGGILIKKTRFNLISEDFFKLLDFCVLCRIFTIDAIQYNDKNTISIIEYDSERKWII